MPRRAAWAARRRSREAGAGERLADQPLAFTGPIRWCRAAAAHWRRRCATAAARNPEDIGEGIEAGRIAPTTDTVPAVGCNSPPQSRAGSIPAGRSAIDADSGCGKSTLLGLRAGCCSRRRHGVGRRRDAGQPQSLTYIFQDFALLPWRSVAANVGCRSSTIRYRPGTREAGRRGAPRTGLSDFAGALPSSSPGACASASALRARWWCDRRCSDGRAVLGARRPDARPPDGGLRAIWAGERPTGAYVTHNLHEALRMADRSWSCAAAGRIREIVRCRSRARAPRRGRGA